MGIAIGDDDDWALGCPGDITSTNSNNPSLCDTCTSNTFTITSG